MTWSTSPPVLASSSRGSTPFSDRVPPRRERAFRPPRCASSIDMDATECRITGLGAYRPGNVVSNEVIADVAGVTPEWIAKRCGVRSRQFAADGEDVESMAVAAAKRALAAA